MPNLFGLRALLACTLAISLNTACALAEPAVSEPKVSRSSDSHVIDELPVFDKQDQEAPTRTVEKQAQQQIKESIQSPGIKDDKGTVKLITTPRQQSDASREATKIERDTPADECQVVKVTRPTIALALGGGGVRGAAHIGVLRVLKEEGIPIDYIVGNSMGSIVGGLYASGVPLDEIEKFMIDDSLHKAYLPSPIPLKVLTSPLEKLLHPMRKHYAGLWSGNKLGVFLEKHLPKEIQNVQDTIIPFSAVATNLIDGKAYRISDGKLSTAMRASSTIPGLLQPVAIGDKIYIDGGVRANLPASAARDTGADLVIAVLVDEPLRKKPATHFQNYRGILSRFGDVMLAVADARQLPNADIVINPDVSGLPVLMVHKGDARRAIDAGAVATRKVIPELRRRLSPVTASHETSVNSAVVE